jgi:molybdate transport system substrate-binding protein
VAAVLLATPAGAGAALAQELLVSAAVSMRDVVEDVGRTLTRHRPGVTVHYNFAASGLLQQQIEAGAPVDVFVSAAAEPMAALERQGLIVAGSRRVFARNVLVVVAPADAPVALARPADLRAPRVRRIAIGHPRTVPAGRYAEQSLRALGLWDVLQPRLVLAENVRQALEYVARGEVEAGVVYATDVRLRAGRVREAFRLPADSHPIVYPAALVKDAPQPELGRALLALLDGPAGRAALERFGFLPAEPVRR